MSSPGDDFKDLQKLLALKRHEQPPPGYFYYLPEKIMVRLEQEQEKESLAVHSTWWEWLVARFDARPWLAGAYACAMSGLLIMGFRVSQIMQAENAEGVATPLARMLDPNNITPAPFLQNHFANPAGLVNFSSTEPVYYEPAPLPFSRQYTLQPTFSQ
jgi:hypothetical protein